MLLAVETGVILGWHKRAGDQGDVIVLTVWALLRPRQW